MIACARRRALERDSLAWVWKMEMRSCSVNSLQMSAAVSPLRVLVVVVIGEEGGVLLVVSGEEKEEEEGWLWFCQDPLPIRISSGPSFIKANPRSLLSI